METGATALVSAYQNGGAIGTRWEARNGAHFGTHTAIWAKSKRAILQSKSVRNGALTEGESISAASRI